MPTGTGISAQLMTAEESTYGTLVTPDRGYEFVSETLRLEIERIQSAGIRSGARVNRSDRWAAGKRTVTGDIVMELANKSFGRWLKHMFGGVSSAQPDAAGNPTVWDHTFTPGDLTGKSLTVQVGRPDVGGTVRPFSYLGCKVNAWELDCVISEIAKLKATLLGRDEDTSTALATASYPASLSLMTFVQGTLTVAGAAVDVRSVSLKGDNAFAEDRYFLGGALRKEPLENNVRPYSGKLEAEFTDLTAYNRFVNGTEASLVLLFQGATISGTYKFEHKVTCNVRFDGETPNVSDRGVVKQPLPFMCLNSGTGDASAITWVMRTTDTAP